MANTRENMETTEDPRSFLMVLGASILASIILSAVIKNSGATTTTILVGGSLLGLGCIAWGTRLKPPEQTRVEKVHPLDVTGDLLLLVAGTFLLSFCLPWTLEAHLQIVEAVISAVLGTACLILGALGISRWGPREAERRLAP